MRAESARELKAELLALVQAAARDVRPLPALALAARRLSDVDPLARTVALGLAPAGREDYRLAVRIQARWLEQSPLLETIRRRSRGEVEVRYVGRVAKRAAPWQRQRRRPLLIGCSLGHHRITAGSLGGFVILRSGGEVRALSNNHVLADEDRGRKGDGILQPATYDGGRAARDRVGSLDSFVRLKPKAANRVDAALAALEPRIEYDPRGLRGLGTLAAQGDLPLETVDRVEKLGRTTAHTRGRVTAFELDNLVVAYDRGNLRFSDQVEIDGAGQAPFSQGGDSGSLIFTSRARQAVALLFAGSDQGGRNGQGLTYANPLAAVLKAVKAELLT